MFKGTIGTTKMSKSVIFATAIKDLNRKDWKGFERTIDDYIMCFMKLIKNHIRIVCFCSTEIAYMLHDRGFFNTYAYDEPNTFFKYIETQRAIMMSDCYKKMIGQRPDPECHYPEYNIVNHNKCIFVQRVKNMFPNYTHYAWIDFGYKAETTKDFDWELLSDKIFFASTCIPGVIPDPETIVSKSYEVMRGGCFVIPKDMVDWYREEYEKTILYFQDRNVVDDDQSLILTIYSKFPDKFKLFITNEWFKTLNYFSCPRKIDVVVPTCKKDIGTVNLVIEKCKKHVKDVGTVYVVCSHECKEYLSGCVFVDENIFPFSKHDSGHSWIYQQLLKLYSHKYIQGISNNFLILDSETIFYNDFSFITDDNRAVYFISNEINPLYEAYMKSIIPGLSRVYPGVSGVCHNMLFQKYILDELFERIEHNGQMAWKTMTENAVKTNGKMSEYDLYFNYSLQFHSNNSIITTSPWDISPTIPETSECIFLTAHAHERGNISYKKFTYRVDLGSIQPRIQVKDLPVIYICPGHNSKYIQRGETTLNLLKTIGFKDITHYKSNTNNYPRCLLDATINILENNLNDSPLLIVEDDIGWTGVTTVDIPQDADAIYMGISYCGGHPTENTHIYYCDVKPYSNTQCRVYNMLSAHAILYISRKYKQAIIDELRKYSNNPRYHGDVIMSRIQKNYTVYGTLFPIFFQDDDSARDVTKIMIEFTCSNTVNIKNI